MVPLGLVEASLSRGIPRVLWAQFLLKSWSKHQGTHSFNALWYSYLLPHLLQTWRALFSNSNAFGEKGVASVTTCTSGYLDSRLPNSLFTSFMETFTTFHLLCQKSWCCCGQMPRLLKCHPGRAAGGGGVPWCVLPSLLNPKLSLTHSDGCVGIPLQAGWTFTNSLLPMDSCSVLP